MEKKKDKPVYTTWQNVIFTFSNMWKWDKPLVWLSAAQAPLKVVSLLAGLYIVRFVIASIDNGSDAAAFIIRISAFFAAVLLINIISNVISAKIKWRQFKIRFSYMNLINYKTMDADYENIENPDGMTKMQKASQTINSDESATQSIMNNINETLAGLINIISLSAILTAINPILLLVITALTLVQHGLHRLGNRWDYQNGDKWALFYRKLGYIDNISGDFARAKDIRLYNLKTWLRDVFSMELRKYIKWEKTAEKHAYIFFDVSYAVIYLLICNGISFAYLIINVLNASITIADAVFYFSAVGAFTNVLTGIMFSVRDLNKNSLAICHLREFLGMADRSNRSSGAALPDSAPEIEFQNVSFTYPGAESPALRNISFTIKKGERVAIVGRNGAGKTTLVKLLCGLYRTSGGSVTIDGREINEYNRDEYYTLISAVFQDIYLFPVSISQNIALCREGAIDEEKITSSVRSAGLEDKINSLPDGQNTFLLKGVLENAVELSGGEKQKLALARALYKDGLLLVLDEPTAALDPIAENEMYLQYSRFAEDKTSVFISHRLASTRFCDRIFYLEDGQIAESGSHDELMKLNGKYAEIFNIQAYYYREEKYESA